MNLIPFGQVSAVSKTDLAGSSYDPDTMCTDHFIAATGNSLMEHPFEKQEANAADESLFNLAFALEKQNRHLEAEEAYNKAINAADAIGLHAGNAMFRIAWMAMNKKKHTKAVVFFQKATQTLKQTQNCRKLTNEAIYWLALNYEALNQPIRALELYCEIRSDSCWFWDVSFRMVTCYDKIGKYEEALICCRQYIDAATENPEAADKKAKYQTQVNSMRMGLEKLLSTT